MPTATLMPPAAKPDRAWKLIEDEARWTKGRSATDADGIAVHEKSQKACKWCAFGALCAIYGFIVAQDIAGWIEINEGLILRCGITRDLTVWNDEVATHADVIAVLKRAEAHYHGEAE